MQANLAPVCSGANDAVRCFLNSCFVRTSGRRVCCQLDGIQQPHGQSTECAQGVRAAAQAVLVPRCQVFSPKRKVRRPVNGMYLSALKHCFDTKPFQTHMAQSRHFEKEELVGCLSIHKEQYL
jgi:hypothetical protein